MLGVSRFYLIVLGPILTLTVSVAFKLFQREPEDPVAEHLAVSVPLALTACALWPGLIVAETDALTSSPPPPAPDVHQLGQTIEHFALASYVFFVFFALILLYDKYIGKPARQRSERVLVAMLGVAIPDASGVFLLLLVYQIAT